MAEKITIRMIWVKETKNCHRYEAMANAATGVVPPVDCIYLQKAALNGAAAPSSLTVEVQLP